MSGPSGTTRVSVGFHTTGSSVARPWPARTLTGLSQTHASTTRPSPAVPGPSHGAPTVYRMTIPPHTARKTPIAQSSVGSPTQPCGSTRQQAHSHPRCTCPEHRRRSAVDIMRADVNRLDANTAMPARTARDLTPGLNALEKGWPGAGPLSDYSGTLPPQLARHHRRSGDSVSYAGDLALGTRSVSCGQLIASRLITGVNYWVVNSHGCKLSLR